MARSLLDLAPTRSAEPESRRWQVVLAALLVAVIVYGFQQTAISPALPVIQHDLHASREWTTWLFSGYFIVASVTPVFLGKLADRSGKRNIFLVALGVFLAGSIGAALAPSIALVVICRLAQGLGGAVFPLAFAIARDELPSPRVSAGIGVLAGGFGFGALCGYTLGGTITQFLGWRWIFWIGAIVLGLATVLVSATVPASPSRRHRSLDTPGAALFGAALTGIIVAVTEGPQRGWAAPLTIAMFVLAVFAAAGWVYRELHTEEPLMDLRVLASRTILLTNAASMLGGYTAIGTSVLLPFLLQGKTGSDLTAFGLAAGPLLTGLVLVPRALGQAVGGPATNPLSRGLGQVPTFAAGMALMTLGAAGLALWRTQLWMILVELAVLGLGFGLVVTVSGSVVTLTADVEETGVATSINSVLRRVGGGIGAQVGVALLAAITLGRTDEAAPAAFTIAFAVAAGVAFVGTICALLVAPRGQRRTPQTAGGR
jgi:MFS family permease